MQHYIPVAKKDKYFTLSNDDQHHILRVLRMKEDDEIAVIFEGNIYICAVKKTNNEIKALILSSQPLATELNTKIKLIYGLPRLEKFELVLQKAVELGISEITPFISERSLIKLDDSKVSSKLQRWNKIVKEASEQSHRKELMIINAPINIKEIKKHLSKLNILADENLSNQNTKTLAELINQKLESVTLLVGPEGGFSLNEVAMFKSIGFTAVSLGKRILRSETAAIYLMSILSFKAESN